MPSHPRCQRTHLTAEAAVTTSLDANARHSFLTGECNAFSRTKVEMFSTLKQTCPEDFPLGVYYVQKSDDSRVLQFALLIAVRCVLPRYENRDIHR